MKILDFIHPNSRHHVNQSKSAEQSQILGRRPKMYVCVLPQIVSKYFEKGIFSVDPPPHTDLTPPSPHHNGYAK